jgi:hypothetical protein
MNLVTSKDERMLFDIENFYDVVSEELPPDVANLF